MNVILAEDDNLVRDGIRLLLETHEGFNVIGEAHNGLEAIELLKNGNKPDVILADINMPDMDGIELIKAVKEFDPKIQVVMLSMLDNEKYMIQSFSEGASGYLLKTVSPDELIFSLRQVVSGERYISSDLSFGLLERSSKRPPALATEPVNLHLNSRELEILKLIGEGLTNSEMGEKLFISRRTVEGHRQNLMDKTGCKNTATLIKYAVLNRLI
ncbi:response regulator transcription factor [Pedobacter sp. SAFR-022]|uniref:response regulator transcription factor n=1 Tax=Pedobacter sp. SAFR-022 TaxID=3436861 RepID=UPI003F7ED35E